MRCSCRVGRSTRKDAEPDDLSAALGVCERPFMPG
jgi:hypothetical protein